MLKSIPTKYRRQAAALLSQFNERGNELTWNSDGIIFIDQTAIPQSDIFVLFPYLFKFKHPKNLQGYSDFAQKIKEMGLEHLILRRTFSKESKQNITMQQTPKNETSSENWWFLG